jgi:hypothetical protein
VASAARRDSLLATRRSWIAGPARRGPQGLQSNSTQRDTQVALR